MSPEKPWLNSSEDGKDDAKNPKRKKSVRFGVPIAEIDAAKPKKAEKPEPKSAGETFIDELKKAGPKESGEAAAEVAKEPDHGEKQAEKPAAEQRGAAEEAEPAGGKNAAQPSASEETYESLPNQEIKPNEFSGGEVIIRLQGDEPVAERVIPLHGETAREAPEDSERPDHPKPAEAPQTVFTRAEAPEPRPEPLAAAGGGELPPPPPPPEHGPASPEPPEPERPVPVIEPPVEILRPQAESTAAILPNVASTAAERPATKAEVEDALHRSAKIHAQRGALSGLFIGTWFANRGLRRRQKQERAELGRQGKQLEQVTSELHAVRRTQESQHVNTEQRLHGVEKRFENPARPEKIAGAQVEKPQSAEEPAEQLEIPKDHHLETSAWHTIEVDSKTGKPAENPTFSYGHEYYQERAHEAAPKDQRNAAAGEVALVAAAMGQASAAAQPPSESSGAHIPLATTQGVPKSTPSTPDPAAAKKSAASPSTSTGPLWPWLVALIVIIICLVIAIH